MEILKRFEEYQNNKKSFDSIVNELENEKKKIDNQIHIFKVLEVASKMQKILDDEIIGKKHEISAIILCYGYDYDYGNELMCDFQDFEGCNEFKKYLPNNIIEFMDDNFRILNGFKKERINYKFSQHENVIINIEENFQEKFMDLMLSVELKSIFNYSKLQYELPVNLGKTSKIKM